MKYIKMLFCIIMIIVGAKYNTKDVNIWVCLLAYSWVDCIFSKD